MTKFFFPQRADGFRHRKQPTLAGNHPAADGADVCILTSAGGRIPANSKILASYSPVLERLLNDSMNEGKSEKVIRILGVPNDGVIAFVSFLQAGCDTLGEETMKKYGMHLLVLSHVYQVKWLKRACEIRLAASLNAEVVVDVLKLARLCDAPWLGLRCMKLVQKDFAGVQMSDAWRFLEDNDPWLELYILQFLHEEDTWKKERRRDKGEKKMYKELSEAMECLVHIFKERCTDINNPTVCHPLQAI